MSSSSSAAAASSSSPSPSKPKQLSKAEFVEYFTLLRQTNPSLTAQEFFAIVHNDHEAAQNQYQAATAAAAAASTPAAGGSNEADATPVVTPVVDAATTTSTNSAATAPTPSSTTPASPMMVNNLRHSKLFAPPATEAAVVPTTTTAPESSQTSSSAITSTGAASVASTAAAADTTTPAPTATATTTPPPPTINIANLKDEIDKRWKEAQKCVHVAAYTSAIILMGSILEGLLLARAQLSVSTAYQSPHAPKGKDGKPIALQNWTLNTLIEVSADVGWIKTDRGKFSHALRDSRNVVHPWQAVMSRANFDESTCKTSWSVLDASVGDLLESLQSVS